MAFMSMVLVFLFAILLILGFVFLVGLVLLIVGIVKRRSPKNKGKKHPTVLIVIGSILMVPLIGGILFVAIYPGANQALTKQRIESYTGIRETWQKEFVFSGGAKTQALEALIKASEDGDKESFKACFSDTVRGNSDFDKRVDAFFAAYPGGFDKDKFVERGGVQGYNYDKYDGSNRVSVGTDRYLTSANGEDFIVVIGYCYKNEDHPEDVGITFFSVRNPGGQAVFEQTFDPTEVDTYKYYAQDYLTCDIRPSGEVNARLISGGVYIWTESDGPVLTRDEMAKVLSSVSTLKEAIDKGLLGNPNVTAINPNSSGCSCYYELKTANGDPLYAYISLDSQLGSINGAYTCSKIEGNYSDNLI